MNWRDEDIMAYVDGEMSNDMRTRFEAALASDPDLAERSEQMRRLANRVRSAYAPVANEPVPDRFKSLLSASAPVGVTGPRWMDRLRDLLAGRLAGQGLAALASLVLGLFVGAQFLAPGPGISGQSVQASAQLAAALDAAGGSDDWNMAVTFRNDVGQYCRAFQASETPTRGVACRDESGWQVRLLLNDRTAASGGYQLAGSSLPPTLLRSIDDMIEGDPLDPESIETAAAAGWRE